MPLIPSSPCPNCGELLNGATGVDEAGPNDDMVPGPGDVTVCIFCGHVCAFNDDLSLREPTSEEMYEIAGDPKMIAIMKARKRAFP